MTLLVPIAQQAVSAAEDDVIVVTGLGSCVALVLVADTTTRSRVAGVAHVLLPDSRGAVRALGRDPMKFADTAVPELIGAVTESGARRRSLQAVLVGGSRMFDFGPSSGRDIGERNVAALRHALRGAGVQVAAEDVGGACGRTVRVAVGAGMVTVRRSRGTEELLLCAETDGRRQEHGASADRR